jgi:hypothetical protein
VEPEIRILKVIYTAAPNNTISKITLKHNSTIIETFAYAKISRPQQNVWFDIVFASIVVAKN